MTLLLVDRLQLASTSPQRRAILTQLGVPFSTHVPAYDEAPLELAPAELVERHASGKAAAVARTIAERPVLGVDTMVVTSSGAVLGKPTSAADARAMITTLAGARHRVLSGLALVGATETFVGHAVTEVVFRALDAPTIDAYVARGEWKGRAGGYAIQGAGATLVERIDGCYSNVVGLPVALLVDAYRALHLPLVPAGDPSASA